MIRLSTSDPGFARDFDALVNARRETDADVARDVRTIIASVRDEGDAAVRAFTEEFDRHDLSETGWRIERAECVAALDALDPDLRAALEIAAPRAAAATQNQRPTGTDPHDNSGAPTRERCGHVVDAGGVRCGWR